MEVVRISIVTAVSPAVTAAPVRASFAGLEPSGPRVPISGDDDGCDRGAGEGEPDEAGRRGDAEEGDRGEHGDGRAGVDAEQPGIGERVAGEALHERARQGQGGAGEHADGRARHALPEDHGVVGDRQVGSQQRVDRPRAGATGRAPIARLAPIMRSEQRERDEKQQTPAPIASGGHSCRSD